MFDIPFFILIVALTLGGASFALMLGYYLLREKDDKEFRQRLNDQAIVAVKNVKAEIGQIVENAISGEMDVQYREFAQRQERIESGLSDRISYMIHETIQGLPEMKNVLFLPEVSLRAPDKGAELEDVAKDLQNTRVTIEIVNNNCKEIQTAMSQLEKHETTLKDWIALKISSNEAEARARFAQMNAPPPPTPRTESQAPQSQTPLDLGIRPIAVAKIEGARPGAVQPLPPLTTPKGDKKESKARKVYNLLKP